MMFILSISVGWADEYSWTLSSTNFVTKNGTSTSSGTTTQNSVSWDFSASEYVSSENGTGGKGVQFGSKKNPDATFTLSTTGIPGTITKVDVEASAYSSSATIGVSVGGTSYGSSYLGTTNSTKSFSGSSSGKIIITLTNASRGGRAMYLKSIKVTYSTGGSQATSHDITYAEVTGGTFTGPTSAVEGAEVTIQATPDDGYNFGSWNVTDASGAIIVTDNKFTMGTSNVTVSGTFVAKPTHTVSVTNGIADPEEAYEGQTVTLTPTIPDGKVVDWDNTTVSPSLEINHSDYTFTMPGQAVTVVFTFKDAPTYTNIFERITSIEQLEAGKRYLLVYENDNKAAGTTEGTHKYLSSQSVTIQNNSITLDDNSSAIPFTLSGSTDTYKLADPDGRFITPTAAKSLILDASGNVTASITFSSNNVVINFGSTYGIMYYNTSDPRFLNYTSTQASIQLYKEVSPAETATLAQIEANPVKDKKYAISDEYLIVAKIIDGIVYAKDNNGADEQTAADGQIDYLAERVNTENTDHSNWIAITGLTDENLTEGSRLTNIVGTLSDAVNFTLAAQSATVDISNIKEPTINQYVPCNFGASTQTVGDKTYFFAHPQIMEYAYIFAAVWKGENNFEVPKNNAAGLTGSFTADLNGYGENLVQGTVYEFHAIVKKAAAGGNGAPRRIAGNGGDYEVMLTEGPKKTSDITTAVDELQSGKAVDGVRYVNVAGQVAATPWQGVNIVVTRYTDGSTRTTKVVK